MYMKPLPNTSQTLVQFCLVVLHRFDVSLSTRQNAFVCLFPAKMDTEVASHMTTILTNRDDVM